MKVRNILFYLLITLCFGFSALTIMSCDLPIINSDSKISDEINSIPFEETSTSNEEKPHVHGYIEIEFYDATCTEAGHATYMCNCGDVAYSTWQPKGHTEVVDEAIAPTCTETGLTAGKHCSECNEVLVEQEVVAALGHTEVIDEAVEATCITTGLTEGKHCSTCNEVLINQKIIEMKQHNYVDYICKDCDHHFYTDGLVFELSSDGASYEVVSYNLTSNDVFIPTKYNGKPVTSINDNAFAYCSTLENVIIPNSVTSIGRKVFYFCTSLEIITIPDSVLSIGEEAFSYCSSLASVKIGNGVTTIGDTVFENCSSLVSVTIGNNVTSIGRYAFSGCSSLTNITIPDSVISIGWRAFNDCNSLKYNTYDNGLYLGNDNNPYVVLMSVSNTNITTCKINEFTKVLYTEAFYQCASLTTIEIPDSVTSIGGQAFMSCKALKSITIPVSMTSIASEAFTYCYALSDVYYTGTADQWNNITIGVSNNYLTNATIVYNYIAEENYTEGLEFTLNTDGESYSVSGYSGTDTNVIIPVIYKGLSVTSIGDRAFYNCSSLESIIIPESVISIGYQSFYKCSSLITVKIPNNVTSISVQTFAGCSSLTSVVVSNSVTSIGQAAFSWCDSLETVYYTGTKEQWNCIKIDNVFEQLTNATIVYNYVEEEN